MGVEQRVSKKLKPLTIFLSDDELVNFKSHFDEFLNMNCDDKIKEQQQEIERLQKDLTYYQEYSADLLNKNNTFENIIKEAREYIDYFLKEGHTKNWKQFEYSLLEILNKGE